MSDKDPAQAGIKLCKDCVYFSPDKTLSANKASQYAKCGRTVSLVTGEPENFCSHEREYNDRGCGPVARFYRARVAD